MQVQAFTPNRKAADRTASAVSFVMLALILFVILYAFTFPDTSGDTIVYVNEILNYGQGGGAKPALIWEFGHLLWRPLGYFLWQLTQPLTASWFQGNPVLEVEIVLAAMNFVGGAVLIVAVFAITRRLGLTRTLALTVSLGVLISNALLNYVHSGTPYVPGLALHMLGIWCILKALQENQQRMLWSALAGVALALACDLWFLYILGLPAAWLSEYLFPAKNLASRERVRLVAVTVASTAAVGLLAYLIGISLCHISSTSQLQTWISSSGHGMRADRPWLRFPTGISRTFLYIGEGGVALKQLVFRDPYATSRWSALIGSGIWKIAMVFVTLGGLVWYMGRIRDGRPVLALLLAAAVPTFAFAFFFETSSSERYLPLYAALIAAVCVILGQRSGTRVPRWLLGIFFGVMLVLNLKMYAFDIRALRNQSSDRAILVHEHTRGNGVAIIMSFNDPLSRYFSRRPFDPANQQNGLPLYHVFDFAALGSTSWRGGASCRALRAWREGGEVWLSKRFLAPRPQLEWGWVEGDYRNLQWTEVRQFFGQFDVDSDLGGPDGFERI
ncbi:MAG: hypothetical protein JO210_12550, partial [Acidobacteriaceae bacterium]|nr:hypothetical protein [Acidobacteriaceae bacterium]